MKIYFRKAVLIFLVGFIFLTILTKLPLKHPLIDYLVSKAISIYLNDDAKFEGVYFVNGRIKEIESLQIKPKRYPIILHFNKIKINYVRRFTFIRAGEAKLDFVKAKKSHLLTLTQANFLLHSTSKQTNLHLISSSMGQGSIRGGLVYKEKKVKSAYLLSLSSKTNQFTQILPNILPLYSFSNPSKGRMLLLYQNNHLIVKNSKRPILEASW